MFLPVRLIVLLLLLAGVAALQIFLSGKESKWPGLVLPVIAFLFSFLYPLSMMAPPEGVTADYVVVTILVWLLANIPTVLLLVIYFACGTSTAAKSSWTK